MVYVRILITNFHLIFVSVLSAFAGPTTFTFSQTRDEQLPAFKIAHFFAPGFPGDMKHQTVDATCTITLNKPTRLDLELNEYVMTPEPNTDACLNAKLTMKQDEDFLGENCGQWSSRSPTIGSSFEMTLKKCSSQTTGGVIWITLKRKFTVPCFYMRAVKVWNLVQDMYLRSSAFC